MNAIWIKSTYSGDNGGDCVEVALSSHAAGWTKSSHSGDTGDCLELARLGGVVAVRDSKRQDGPVLLITAGGWRAFRDGLKDGGFGGSTA
ncbi:hypothetical protein Sru01_58840 [Sphaerisporangium rufum]|uniref:DUF397 domain-containing protein n=1 Tax=Sphaerisporangium rufum TaxID=1381558 RepID=A0A919RBF9_9ACTN|nr:DUF397 domain-containing protein [Sphaerisporangium rufum]GII80902.1 hypothetical protein Sru01_58840 [Sphaerisporangium rufum]